ncbi:GNAT family N-acetyltransferase [Candidatus Aalborgicola defluviihabitans]|uniref:GNAT family N-acetyltransferase n=1 Tax=Candidatus Aalborgicola defluviihabitans TaxID=3386187 RepID=UPI0039B8ABEE
MVSCETARLQVSHFTLDDAAFVLRLLNEPSFIRAIADKGVRTLEDARAYLRNGPLASYVRNGFGLCRVSLKSTGQAIGMCGLIRREGLADVDVGYALLPEYCSQGYAVECVRAVLDNGACQHDLRRVIAVVNPDNADSIRVLERCGFDLEGVVTLPGETTPIQQFAKAMTPGMRLTPQHAPQYRALMLQAYALHPDAFTSSVAEREALPLAWWEQRLTTTTAARAREAVFGAFVNSQLVGAVGLTQAPRQKASHKVTLFGMVVQAEHRHAGLGQLLVQTALDHARTWPGVRQVLLTVTQGNDRAQALYARNGFVAFGVEPDAVAVGSRFVGKVHMWCPFARAATLASA